MKCRFLSVLIVAGAAMCASAAWGQAPKGMGGNESAEEMAQRQLERIDKTVGLTDAQKTKLSAIYKEQAEKLKGLREQMQKIAKEYRTKEDAVLTDEQKSKLKEQRKAWRENGERNGDKDRGRFGGDDSQKGPGSMVDASINFLDKKLSLTDDQKTQIKGFYNEKGNVSAKVRNSIKDQAIARMLYALQNDEMLTGSVKNADGGISVPVCTNERGETVYALMAITISTKDPAVKTEH